MPAQPVELRIVSGMARYGLVVIAPVAVLAGLLLRGPDGALGVASGIGLAFGNYVLAAAMLVRAKTPTAVHAIALAGFVGRLVVVGVALYAFRQVSALDFPSLGLALCLGHLAFMTIEARYLGRAMSLAGE